jgi:ketosteroid isomerase-like protein
MESIRKRGAGGSRRVIRPETATVSMPSPLNTPKDTIEMKTALLGLGVIAMAAAGFSPAYADDDPATFVRAHVQKIAAGDTQGLAADYRPDAILWWVGGPLDGSYPGATIAGVWKKFVTAQGLLTPDVAGVTVDGNPKGQTVVADVTYTGAHGSLRVRQVILVRDGHVQDEIWQLVPKGQ